MDSSVGALALDTEAYSSAPILGGDASSWGSGDTDRFGAVALKAATVSADSLSLPHDSPDLNSPGAALVGGDGLSQSGLTLDRGAGPSPQVATTGMAPGSIAVIGYNTSMSDGTGNPALIDKIYVVLLQDIGQDTQINMTDRTWNGSAFSNSGSDGTYTYNAPSNLTAGTVIALTASNFGGAGVDFDFVPAAGEAVYFYQGPVNAPTNFLYALEAGDGNATFTASLANTGLSLANGTAAAIAYDSAAYAGPTTYAGSFLYNGAGVSLLNSISDSTNWVGNDQTGQNALEMHVQSGKWLVAADMDMWAAASGGGNGIVSVGEDSTVSGGGATFDTSILYNTLTNGGTTGGNATFYHPSDIVFDTVDGKFFLVDSDLGGGHNRILQGNIADLLANPGVVPTLTVLYHDDSTAIDATNRLDNLEVDVANNIIYFTHADQLLKVNYDTANQAGTVLFRANVDAASSPSGVGNPAGSASNFYNDMAIDFSAGKIYLSSTRVSTGTPNLVTKNYIYELSGLTTSSGTNAFQFAAANAGTAHLLTFAQNDANYDVTSAGTSAATTHSTPASAQPYFWPKERGSLDGLAVDQTTHTLYFSTGAILFDHDSNSGTAPVYVGGIVASYALTGNAAGNATILFQQPSQFSAAVPGLMGDLEIDTVTGKYYVTDYNGTNGSNEDQHIWTGALGSAGTPTQFSSDIGNLNGLSTIGMTINHAPTITGTNAAQAVTEASNGPSSPETSRVGLFSAVTIGDTDTSTADEITGAVVRISSGFQSGATHQDYLRIGGTTSGTIGGSGIAYTYSAATGAMVLTGAATIAEYKAAIESVTFSTSGDDVTAYGSDALRTIAAAVSDGLSISDEITATVAVTGINDAPVNSVGSAQSTTEDITNYALTGVVVYDVDVNPASQNLTVTLSVAHGTLSLGSITGLSFGPGDGTNDTTMTFSGTANAINAILGAVNGLTYTPIRDYNGTADLTITTSDGGLNGTGGTLSDTDTKTITISAVADINGDTLSFAEDSGTHNLAMPNNDTFENSDRAITSVVQALHGTVTINNNGTAGDNTDDFLVYTQDPDYNGTDAFLYTVTSGGVTETAQVDVNISAVVDIANDSVTVGEDSGANALDLLGNDSFEGSGRFISGVGSATHGTVAINNNGTAGDTTDDFVTYTPSADYNGGDSFTYTVTSGGVTETATATVTVTAVVDIVDDSVSVAEDSGSNQLDLLGNDNFESSGRFISAVGAASHGTVAINNNGTAGDATDDYVTYTPTGDYNGSDSFTYTVTSGGVTETATATVTVTPVNDAPVFTGLDGTPTFTEGGAAVTLDGNATVSDIDLTATNYAGAALSMVRLGGANSGDVFGTTGTLAFTGAGSGDVTVGATTVGTYTQVSGTLAISFNSFATQSLVNSVLQQITYSDTSDNPPGSVTIGYSFNDGNAGAQGPGGPSVGTGSVTISITPTNDAPTAAFSNHNLGPATEQTAFDLKNSGLSVDDVDGNAGSETVTLAVGTGVLNVTAGTSGAGVSGSGTATVTITGTIAQINALLNTDGTSTVSYLNSSDTPPASTSIALTIHDNGSTGGGDLSGTDSGTISITAVDDTPVVDLNTGTAGIDDSSSYTEGGAAAGIGAAIAVTDVDSSQIQSATIALSDPRAGDLLSVVGALPAGISIDPSTTSDFLVLTGAASAASYTTALGQVTFSSTSDDPTVGGVATTRSIGVTVNDGTSTSVPATLTVTITPQDDAPVAVADATSTNENATVNIAVVANDTDVDGGPKAVGYVDGQVITSGNTVSLASGATVKLESDGTLTYDPNGKFGYLVTAATATATGATDSNTVDSFSYTLNGNSVTTVNVTVNGVTSSGDQLRGTSGDETITGTSSGDFFNLSQGGTDTATGGGGSDGFYFSGGLDTTDSIDGGTNAGTDDQVGLQGNFTYTFGANNLLNIETLAILSGHDTRFGDNSGSDYSYNLTTVNANVAAGTTLIVNANNLAAGENLTFNGSAETDGKFLFYAGLGIDNLTGGQLDDGFFFGEGGRFAPTDHVDGQGGTDDQLGIRGDYSALTTFSATSMVNVETLALLSAQDSRFAPLGTAYDYNLKLDNANVASGSMLMVTGNNLRADESMSVDGSAETDGWFRFVGGAGDDTLIGGAGDDRFTGGLGKDAMTGNGGADTFYFRTTAESAVGANADQITDFTLGDHIDLSAIDAIVGGGNDAFTFLDSGAFTNHAGEARITGAGASWTLQVDTDGDGTPDMEIAITTTGGHTPVASDFIL